MKKALTCTLVALMALFLSLPTIVSAGDADNQQNDGVIYAYNQKNGGFSGPSISQISVAEAKKMSDDTHVKLIGKIEKHLGSENYLFTDATDSVIVEIDHDVWRGLEVSPDDTVIIYGEIDKNFFDFKIEADKILKP